MQCPKLWLLGLMLFVGAAKLPSAEPVAVEFDQLEGATSSVVRTTPAGQPTSSIIVRGRWTRGLELPLKLGEPLTSDAISATQRALLEAIRAKRMLGQSGRIIVTYIDTEVTPAADGVGSDVVFRPYHVDLAMTQIGETILPLPRTPFPSFLENVPAALRFLNPAVGLAFDGTNGTTARFVSGGPVATLNRRTTDESSSVLRLSLDHQLELARSLDEPFRDLAGQLNFKRTSESGVAREFRAGAGYRYEVAPLGEDEQRSHDAHVDAGVFLRLGAHTRAAVNASLRRLHNEVIPVSGAAAPATRTNAQRLRLLIEGLAPSPWHGFYRAAAWWDHGDVAGGVDYHRFAGRAGYEREFLVGTSQTIGLELLAGAGTTSRTTPTTDRFFGGNEGSSFLYDNRDGVQLLASPSGPVIRSFGARRAGLPDGLSTGATGGTTYWHANLNVSIPVPFWSRPLIPHESIEITDDAGRPFTLRSMLKRQIHGTGQSMLAQYYVSQGMPQTLASEKAYATLEEIRPATEFIIDRANIFAVKPVLMLDVAGIRDQITGASETWTAAGAGLEVHVATARVELAYFRTLSGPTFGDRDNVSVRLIFRNLF